MGRWLLAVLLSQAGCESAEPPSGAVVDSTRTLQRSFDVRVTESVLGLPTWILEADEATHDDETEITNLSVLRVTFFDEAGDTTSVLTADEGEADRRTRHLIARRNVVVRTQEGHVLETEVLEWDNGRQKIFSEEPVRITEGRNVYTGIGLVSDPSLRDFEIQRDFRGTILPEETDGDTGG